MHTEFSVEEYCGRWYFHIDCLPEKIRHYIGKTMDIADGAAGDAKDRVGSLSLFRGFKNSLRYKPAIADRYE